MPPESIAIVTCNLWVVKQKSKEPKKGEIHNSNSVDFFVLIMS